MGIVRGGRLVVAVVMLAALSGCVGEGGSEADGTSVQTHADSGSLAAYGAVERKWLGALGAWRERLDATLWDFDSVVTDERIETGLKQGDEETEQYVRGYLVELSGCSESFRSEVGRSPTMRLRRGAEAILTACEYLERGAEESLEDLQHGRADPFFDGGSWIASGRDRLWTSNQQILLRADGRRLIPRGRREESQVDVGLSEAANRITGITGIGAVTLEVRCWSEEDWPEIIEELSAFTNGAVTEETEAWTSYLVRIHVSPAACGRLTDLESGKATIDETFARPLVAFARALAVFYGFRETARTECWAIQVADDVARALGVGAADARALARLYWERVYPQLPSAARSEECRPGGLFDHDPDRPAWP